MPSPPAWIPAVFGTFAGIVVIAAICSAIYRWKHPYVHRVEIIHRKRHGEFRLPSSSWVQLKSNAKHCVLISTLDGDIETGGTADGGGADGGGGVGPVDSGGGIDGSGHHHHPVGGHHHPLHLLRCQMVSSQCRLQHRPWWRKTRRAPDKTGKKSTT